MFSGQPHCDSKGRCLSKEVKTISDWQAMKTTEWDGEEAKDSCKKCHSNFGKVRRRKPEKRRTMSSWKANWPFVPPRSSRSQLQLCGKHQEWVTLWRRSVVFPRDCLSQVGCSWKSGLRECGEETHAFLSTFFVSPSTLQREGFYLWLKYLHLFFFLQKEAGEPALPHRWFPIKIINNNVGTLFLERRFVSVPKWANRGKISCYILRKK